MILVLSSFVSATNLINPDAEWKIEKQDYIQEYIDYDFKYVGNNLFQVSWKVNNRLVFDSIDCLDSKDSSCFDDKINRAQIKDRKNIQLDSKNKYNKEKYIKDFFKDESESQLDTDFNDLKTNKVPKHSLIGNVEFIGDIDPLNKNYGSFILDLKNGTDEYYKIKIGFGTLIATFNNSLSEENVTLYKYPGFIEDKIRYIEVPKYVNISSSQINLTGINDSNAIYSEWDYFSNGDNWITSGTTGNDITTFGNYMRVYATKLNSETTLSQNAQSYSDYTNIRLINGSSYLLNFTYSGGCSCEGGSFYTCGYHGYIYISDTSTDVLIYSNNNEYSPSGGNSVWSTTIEKKIYKININDSFAYIYNEDNTLIYVKDISALNQNQLNLKFLTQSGGTNPDTHGLSYIDVYASGQNSNRTQYLDYTFSNKYPNNFNFYVGDSLVSSYSELNESKLLDIKSSLVTALNSGSCDCTDCVLEDDNCLIPFTFSSDEGGSVLYQDIDINYTFTGSNLDVYIYDAEDKTLLTGLNLTVQLVGDIFQLEETTITAYTNFSFPFTVGDSDTISLRTFQTSGTDYSITINQIEVEQGQNYSFNVYITNTSDVATTNLVTFHVKSEDWGLLEDAAVKIQKQDPSTNTYLPITDLTTNSNGAATTILVVDTVFYRWVVYYKDAIVYTLSAPTTLSLNDDDIWISAVISEDFTDEIDDVFNTISATTLTRPTNESGYFTTTFDSVNTVTGCQDIYIVNSSGGFFVEETCLANVSFGTITSSTFTPNNRTFYTSRFYVDYQGGNSNVFIGQFTGYIGQVANPLGSVEGLFLPIIVLVFSAVGFLATPILGLIILAAGFIIISITGLVPQLTIEITMIVVSLAIITMVTITRIKKNVT